LVAKACPVVLRTIGRPQKYWSFAIQPPACNWSRAPLNLARPADAALRELAEEAGIAARIVGSLGSSQSIADGQLWHFFQCDAGALPEDWVHHAEDDGGHDFAFSWWPLSRPLDPASWHRVFIRALDHVRLEFSPPRDSG
jgi:8-oxo-dGTP pyrophosphatase MutT (NUDIX family)